MVVRLLSGILVAVFVPLGVVFAVLGGVVGVPFLAAGLACAAVFVLLLRKEKARRARRSLRATAEVVSAKINHGVQLNQKRQLVLTVRLLGNEVSGAFFWLPADPIGERIEVEYDPAEPANFAPVPPRQ